MVCQPAAVGERSATGSQGTTRVSLPRILW